MVIEYQNQVNDGGSNPLTDVRAVDVLNVGGNTFAITGGDDNTLAVYSIDNDELSPTYGHLSSTPVQTVADNGTLKLDRINGIDSMEVDGTTYVFAVGEADNGISVFSMDATGTLTNTDNVSDNITLRIGTPKAVTTGQVDDGAGGVNSFVFVGGDNNGISAFQVDGTGTLTNTANFVDSGATYLSDVWGLNTVTVDDGAGGTNTFLIAGGRTDDGVSVFEVDASGNLTNTDNVADDATLRLNAVQAIETTVIDGQGYVFAAGAEGGISSFEIDATGNLTNVGNLTDDGSRNLADVREMTVTVDSGVRMLWAASVDGGLDAYSINIDPGTGAVTLTRVIEFDSGTYDTSEMEAIDADGGFVVGAQRNSSPSISSFTSPCFTPGTRILTPSGPVAVEDLAIGDLVVTADRGPQPVRWIGVREMVFDDAALDRHRPIEIKAGSLGNGLPSRSLRVSPQHRMLFSGPAIQTLFGASEVIGPAKGLVRRAQIRQLRGRRRETYYALLFDRHEIIFAEVAPTESFRPGPGVLPAFGAGDRERIFALYPGLRDQPQAALGPPARQMLKRSAVLRLTRITDGPLVDAARYDIGNQPDVTHETLRPARTGDPHGHAQAASALAARYLSDTPVGPARIGRARLARMMQRREQPRVKAV